MGEKQDDKEKKQQQPKEGCEKEEDKKPQGDGGGGEKKSTKEEDGGGPITVVLKIGLHCEGCAKRVRRCVSSFQGVEKVSVEMESSKVTVVGKVDAWKLRERLEVKTHKKVVLVSPTDPPKKKDEPKEGAAKKVDKPKEETVALKILLHCEGCKQKIERNIMKFEGVRGVNFDDRNDLVVVKGIMKVKAMVPYLRLKLRRGVEVVAPKEQKKEGGGGGDKKEKKEGGGGGGEKGEKKGGDGEKEKKGGGGGGEKKEEGGGEKKKQEGGGGEGKVEANKMEHCYYGGVGGYYHYPQLMNAPQMFSDENPNACSLM